MTADDNLNRRSGLPPSERMLLTAITLQMYHLVHKTPTYDEAKGARHGKRWSRAGVNHDRRPD